jgi:hypothetical protein
MNQWRASEVSIMPFIFRDRPEAVDGFARLLRGKNAEFRSGFAGRNRQAREWDGKSGLEKSEAKIFDRKIGNRNMKSRISRQSVLT